MNVNVLFSAPESAWPAYQTCLTKAAEAAGLRINLAQDHPADSVDYIVYAPNGGLKDFTPFTRCKAVLSLWAGVEKITPNPTLTQPLTRMVDSGLRQGMVEWVVGHTLRHHLGMDAHILGQNGIWRETFPPLAKDRPITILGLGALGQACGEALVGLGFPVQGWSRGPKKHPDIRTFSGESQLLESLKDAQGVVLLLPSTPATEGIFNATAMASVAKGAFVLNPGRGTLIDDAALLAALDSGQIGHATLDVFRTEPLPASDPYWAHPQVTVTPHIASTTRPGTASVQIIENIVRCEKGEPLLHLVDRALGY